MNAFQPAATNQNIQMPQSVRDATQSIGNGVSNIAQNVTQSLSEFSKQASAGAGASTQFLYSNTIIAKFAFLILVIIVFIFLLGLGISLIGYYISPSKNPYLIKGQINASNGQTISQDPTQQNAIPISRSNNKSTGIEYTWSVWLYINDLNNSNKTYQHVFSKGDASFDPTTSVSTVNNAPGLYIKPGADGTNECTLNVIMNTSENTDGANSLEIDNIPLRKWVHVAVRLENTMLDVYINGTISGRLNLPLTPKQNYNDVQVCQNGGFAGNLADLRYFSYALSIIEINKIVYWGPNLKVNSASSATAGGYGYLSSMWYSSRL
jgi:hypothetical protein